MKTHDDGGEAAGAATIESIQRLTKDLKQAAATLSSAEARFLVDFYYDMQGNRIRAGNQLRALAANDEPHATLTWVADNAAILERRIRSALDVYGDAHAVGRWAKSIKGIAEVISAGLLANIDINKAATAGAIWRFAGLDPTSHWEKGQKRPWNASLKRLCWLLGESFVKVSGYDDDVYGHLYVTRKAYEQARNARGDLAEQAAQALVRKKFRPGTGARAAYESGKLPPAHVHARAKRWAVKQFLAHYHEAAWFSQFGTLPAKPYAAAHLDHVHPIPPPHTELIDGWTAARRRAGWDVS